MIHYEDDKSIDNRILYCLMYHKVINYYKKIDVYFNFS